MNEHRFRVGRIVGLTVAGVVFAGLFALVFGYLVMVLWNWLMPSLFGLKMIGYWQAFGIIILAKLIFGGFGPLGHDRRRSRLPHKYGWEWRDCSWSKTDDWAPKGSYQNWKYYDRYWREEGKAAFEAYLDRLDKEKQTGPDRPE